MRSPTRFLCWQSGIGTEVEIQAKEPSPVQIVSKTRTVLTHSQGLCTSANMLSITLCSTQPGYTPCVMQGERHRE